MLADYSIDVKVSFHLWSDYTASTTLTNTSFVFNYVWISDPWYVYSYGVNVTDPNWLLWLDVFRVVEEDWLVEAPWVLI